MANSGEHQSLMDTPAGKLPWLVTGIGGALITLVGFLAARELSRLSSSVEASSRATVELRSEMRDQLGAVRVELVGLSARQTRGDEISAETRSAVRELERELKAERERRAALEREVGDVKALLRDRAGPR